MGEELIKKENILNKFTGAIQNLPDVIWDVIGAKFSPSSSSPFTDWGYVWTGKRSSTGKNCLRYQYNYGKIKQLEPANDLSTNKFYCFHSTLKQQNYIVKEL